MPRYLGVSSESPLLFKHKLHALFPNVDIKINAFHSGISLFLGTSHLLRCLKKPCPSGAFVFVTDSIFLLDSFKIEIIDRQKPIAPTVLYSYFTEPLTDSRIEVPAIHDYGLHLLLSSKESILQCILTFLYEIPKKDKAKYIEILRRWFSGRMTALEVKKSLQPSAKNKIFLNYLSVPDAKKLKSAVLYVYKDKGSIDMALSIYNVPSYDINYLINFIKRT